MDVDVFALQGVESLIEIALGFLAITEEHDAALFSGGEGDARCFDGGAEAACGAEGVVSDAFFPSCECFAELFGVVEWPDAVAEGEDRIGIAAAEAFDT